MYKYIYIGSNKYKRSGNLIGKKRQFLVDHQRVIQQQLNAQDRQKRQTSRLAGFTVFQPF